MRLPKTGWANLERRDALCSVASHTIQTTRRPVLLVDASEQTYARMLR